MKLDQIVLEANIAAKLKDPKTVKMLGIAMRHDGTLPRDKVAKLGTKPDDQALLQLWSEMLDSSLRSTDYGDLSADGKFDDWLTRLYINGVVDFEDINGEGGDALGAWKALSIRGKLKEKDQDFNRFKNLRQLQAVIQTREYRDELRRIKDAETIEKHKREKKEITLIDNDRFLVTLPLNYGACYTFNNSEGYQASFCTGSSSGLRWFNNYAPDGPIISIVDKQNHDDVNGKWQMHGPTGQMNNGNQSLSYSRGDAKFAELFPGLMKEIIAALVAKGDEVKKNSTEIVSGGYDIQKAVADIKSKLPHSYASEKPKPEGEPEEPAAEQGPGTFIVTLLANGRTARIEADSEEDAINKVIERHPSLNREQLSVERAPAE